MTNNTDDAATLPALQNAVQSLASELECLKAEAGFVPPGHFYSPIPARTDILRYAESLDESSPRSELILDVDLNVPEQLRTTVLLSETIKGDLPFSDIDVDRGTKRYCFNNGMFDYNDAITLHGMLRLLRPRRVVEIGSGWSSAMILDTNSLFLNDEVACTFIEPFPATLISRLRPGDRDLSRLIVAPVQEVALDEFERLEPGDILFIDSSHVVKAASDVQYILNQVVPRLRTGVYVHFHDIFFPFEYPKSWLLEGRYWNECYMLRSFLAYNSCFSIVYFNDYLRQFHPEALAAVSPLCLLNTGGSIWLRRIA